MLGKAEMTSKKSSLKGLKSERHFQSMDPEKEVDQKEDHEKAYSRGSDEGQVLQLVDFLDADKGGFKDSEEENNDPVGKVDLISHPPLTFFLGYTCHEGFDGPLQDDHVGDGHSSQSTSKDQGRNYFQALAVRNIIKDCRVVAAPRQVLDLDQECGGHLRDADDAGDEQHPDNVPKATEGVGH